MERLFLILAVGAWYKFPHTRIFWYDTAARLEMG
jgi:hypothetical protein